MRVLIIGASGMLGSMATRVFSDDSAFEVFGSVRKSFASKPAFGSATIIDEIDVTDSETLINLLKSVQPKVVLNCVGVIKQKSEGSSSEEIIEINSLFPHKLCNLGIIHNFRVIHMSTDCVFSGSVGGYTEESKTDPLDLYGQSKLLGEVTNYRNAVTIRTSIIGHELESRFGLVEWFLSQKGEVQGFEKAIFSGFPTVELSNIIKDIIIPNNNLSGLYHVATSPISKFNLLKLIADEYGVKIEIEPSNEVVINRSLLADKFNEATGYQPPNWKELIRKMKSSRLQGKY